MFTFLWSLGAFIVALGILVAVHEWGHFYVARRCGVKVERFSIGFGKPLWRTHDKQGTEFVVAAIPLGGYVRMLDERVDDVPPELRHKAFNTQSVGKRMAIIAAGPGVNFIFAVFALWVMFLIGQQTVKPVVGDVAPNSIAAQAGLAGGQEIIRIGDRNVADWEMVNMELVSVLGQSQADVTVIDANKVKRNVTLSLSGWNFDPDKESALDSLGITPFRPAITMLLSVVGEDSPAQRAGLQVGDKLTSFNGQPVDDWMHLVDEIKNMPGAEIQLGFERQGEARQVTVVLDRRDTEQGQQGYLGVSPTFEPWPEGYVFTHQYGPVDAFTRAMKSTWRRMEMSLDMFAKLFTGVLNIKNLSGPISIAQGAGISAGYGLVTFLSFLAWISVSLGIINLLPIPMLDGGHLMYFIIEWLTGKPVSEEVQEWGFRIGGILLFTVMSIAIFNDISRIA